MAQNDPKSTRKRLQEAPKRLKKAIPNRKTKKGPNQDDPKTVLDRPRVDLPSSAALPGLHLGGQNGTQIDPKTMKTDTKNQDEKKQSKTILDPSWGDLGPSWAPSWADLDLKIVLSPSVALVFLKNHFFDVKTVRRRLWDQLWPAKAPK